MPYKVSSFKVPTEIRISWRRCATVMPLRDWPYFWSPKDTAMPGTRRPAPFDFVDLIGDKYHFLKCWPRDFASSKFYMFFLIHSNFCSSTSNRTPQKSIRQGAGRHARGSIIGGVLTQLRVVGSDHVLRAAEIGIRKAHFVVPLAPAHVVKRLVPTWDDLRWLRMLRYQVDELESWLHPWISYCSSEWFSPNSTRQICTTFLLIFDGDAVMKPAPNWYLISFGAEWWDMEKTWKNYLNI